MRMAVYVCLLWTAGAWAQVGADGVQLLVERAGDGVYVTAQVRLELPAAVEDAAQKGVALSFIAQAEVLRARWYWYDKRVSLAQRTFRLTHHPLTRRWRLSVTAGADAQDSPGLALNQDFDSLAQALQVAKRVSRWRIADVNELDTSEKYTVKYRFRLDVSQLPLPFQIGTLGQADWDVGVTLDAPLSFDAVR